MKVTDQQIIEAATSSATMAEGARKVGLHLSAFVHRTKKLGVHKPNPARRGIPKGEHESENNRIPLEEILAGKHPQYGTTRLKSRLIAAGVMDDVCSRCGDASLEYARILDHQNGINNDHRLDNLRLLCPNCNAALPTHAGRNKKRDVGVCAVSDEEMIRAIMAGSNNRDILRQMDMTPNGANYRRVDRLKSIVTFVLQNARVGER